jgi:hypothetical protein
MTKTIQGVVHGKVIELTEESGLPDGQVVEVTVRSASGNPSSRPPLPTPPDWQPGGSKSAAGALAGVWTAEDDRILQELEDDRQRAAFREASE